MRDKIVPREDRYLAYTYRYGHPNGCLLYKETQTSTWDTCPASAIIAVNHDNSVRAKKHQPDLRLAVLISPGQDLTCPFFLLLLLLNEIISNQDDDMLC